MSRRKALIPEANTGLNSFKMEVAEDMGLDSYKNRHKSMAGARNADGEMAKRMMAAMEHPIDNKDSKY